MSELVQRVSSTSKTSRNGNSSGLPTYALVVLLPELFTHELVLPFGCFVAFQRGHDARYNERHYDKCLKFR